MEITGMELRFLAICSLRGSSMPGIAGLGLGSASAGVCVSQNAVFCTITGPGSVPTETRRPQ